jgi:3-hydroxyisobutyrate dehydrogenase
MILGISMIGVAEAFVLAEKLGLSHQALFDVAATSSGQCWSLTSYCPEEAAQANGAATPLGAEATQLYALFNAQGHGAADFSGIIRFLRGDAA